MDWNDILRAKGLPVNPGYNPGATMTGSGENAYMRVNVPKAGYQAPEAFNPENALEAYQRAQALNQSYQDRGWATNVHGSSNGDERFGALFDPTTGYNFGQHGNGGFYAYDNDPARVKKDNIALNGLPYYNFGTDGSYQGSKQWEGLDKTGPMQQIIPLAMMLAPFAMAMAGVGGAAGAGAGAAGSGGAGLGAGSGAFLGEGALSGIGAWDAALAAAPSWSGAAGAAGGALGQIGGNAGGFVGEGVASGIPGWDAAAGLGGSAAGGGASGGGFMNLLKSAGSSLFGGGGAGGAAGGGGSSLLGLGATLLGGLGGSQGNNASATSTKSMDPRMEALFYGDLAQRAQAMMGAQMPAAMQAGGQMLGMGSGLLGQTAPTTATNPYLSSIADDMQRRTQEMLGKNNQQIAGNAIGVGGLGGSRQGVAQGIAAGQAADNLQGNLASLYGGAYNQDQNRLRQDWTLGAGLMNQGLQTPWQPIQNTSQTYAPFTGFGTTTNSQESGGGWMGGLGGALGAAQFGKNMGWWG
jgi:hypothetical protein